MKMLMQYSTSQKFLHILYAHTTYISEIHKLLTNRSTAIFYEVFFYLDSYNLKDHTYATNQTFLRLDSLKLYSIKTLIRLNRRNKL